MNNERDAMMTPARIQEFLRSHIALAESMDAHVVGVEGDRFVIEAPMNANFNHLGTAFGGSIAAMAMLAAYGLVWSRLGDSRAHLVIKEGRIRYRRPIKRLIRAEAFLPREDDFRQFLAEYEATGRATLPIDVIFPDEEAEPGKEKPAALFRGVFVAI